MNTLGWCKNEIIKRGSATIFQYYIKRWNSLGEYWNIIALQDLC